MQIEGDENNAGHNVPASPAAWEMLSGIVAEAIESAPVNLSSFLHERLGEKGGLIAEAQNLIAAHREAGDFLDLAEQAPEFVDTPEGPGWQFDDYTLLEELGEGGMGRVWLARETKNNVNRQVALKILKRGLDTDEFLRRFNRERQVLASLEHPGIASYYNSGTTPDSRPFLVMQRVHGQPVDQYCKEKKLSQRQRLRLFQRICTAVQYAHQQLIVHRDLKPGNIMVDDHAAPTILDFGISKILTQDDDATIITSAAHSRPLTLNYASPEQLVNVPITPASDVYSLGIILYELLAGTRPYDITNCGNSTEAVRVVCETDHPRPSAAARKLASRKGRISADLDAIVMLAMHKDRTRRYGSVLELSNDVERFLKYEPVTAKPPSYPERVVKHVRRHRIGVSVSALIVILVSVGTTLIWLEKETSLELTAELETQNYTSQLQLAQAALDDGNISAMKAHLLECPVNHRGWAWKHLQFVSDESIATLKGHSQIVKSVAVSGSGKLVASGSQDETVRLWDSESGRQLHAFRGHAGEVLGVAFSPDESMIVSSGEGGQVIARDVDTGARVWTATLATSHATHVAWSPEGSTISVAGTDCVIRLLQADNGTHIRSFERPVGDVVDMGYADGGKWLVASYTSGAIIGWEVATGLRRRVGTASQRNGGLVATHAQSTRLAIVDHGELTITDMFSDEELAFGIRPSSRVNDLAFDGTGDWLALGRIDGLIEIRSGRTGQLVQIHRGHESGITQLCFAANANRLATASADHTVRIWDPGSNRDPLSIHLSSDSSPDLVYANHGATLATAVGFGLVVWDAVTTECITRDDGHRLHVVAVTVNSDGTMIATGSGDGSIKLWDSTSYECVATLGDRDHGGISAVAFGQDDLVFGAYLDGTLCAWSGTTPAPLWCQPGSAEFASMATSESGDTLATGDTDGMIRIVDPATGTTLREFKAHDLVVRDLEIDPKGVRLYSAGYDGLMKCWDLASILDSAHPQPTVVFKGNGRMINGVAISPDGVRVATSDLDGTVRIWMPSTERELLKLETGRQLFDVAFSPDGTQLAAIGSGWLTIWETASPSPDKLARRNDLMALREPIDALFAELVLSRKVVEAVTTSPDIPDSLRDVAMELAREYPEDAYALSERAWYMVRFKDGDSTEYRDALVMARRTCELVTDNPGFWNTLGVAEYRNGLYRAAAESLTKALQNREPAPQDLAFRAMAYFKLGLFDEANRDFDALDEIMERHPYNRSGDAHAYCLEAKETLER